MDKQSTVKGGSRMELHSPKSQKTVFRKVKKIRQSPNLTNIFSKLSVDTTSGIANQSASKTNGIKSNRFRTGLKNFLLQRSKPKIFNSPQVRKRTKKPKEALVRSNRTMESVVVPFEVVSSVQVPEEKDPPQSRKKKKKSTMKKERIYSVQEPKRESEGVGDKIKTINSMSVNYLQSELLNEKGKEPEKVLHGIVTLKSKHSNSYHTEDVIKESLVLDTTPTDQSQSGTSETYKLIRRNLSKVGSNKPAGKKNLIAEFKQKSGKRRHCSTILESARDTEPSPEKKVKIKQNQQNNNRSNFKMKKNSGSYCLSKGMAKLNISTIPESSRSKNKAPQRRSIKFGRSTIGRGLMSHRVGTGLDRMRNKKRNDLKLKNSQKIPAATTRSGRKKKGKILKFFSSKKRKYLKLRIDTADNTFRRDTEGGGGGVSKSSKKKGQKKRKNLRDLLKITQSKKKALNQTVVGARASNSKKISVVLNKSSLDRLNTSELIFAAGSNKKSKRSTKSRGKSNRGQKNDKYGLKNQLSAQFTESSGTKLRLDKRNVNILNITDAAQMGGNESYIGHELAASTSLELRFSEVVAETKKTALQTSRTNLDQILKSCGPARGTGTPGFQKVPKPTQKSKNHLFVQKNNINIKNFREPSPNHFTDHMDATERSLGPVSTQNNPRKSYLADFAGTGNSPVKIEEGSIGVSSIHNKTHNSRERFIVSQTGDADSQILSKNKTKKKLMGGVDKDLRNKMLLSFGEKKLSLGGRSVFNTRRFDKSSKLRVTSQENQNHRNNKNINFFERRLNAESPQAFEEREINPKALVIRLNENFKSGTSSSNNNTLQQEEEDFVDLDRAINQVIERKRDLSKDHVKIFGKRKSYEFEELSELDEEGISAFQLKNSYKLNNRKVRRDRENPSTSHFKIDMTSPKLSRDNERSLLSRIRVDSYSIAERRSRNYEKKQILKNFKLAKKDFFRNKKTQKASKMLIRDYNNNKDSQENSQGADFRVFVKSNDDLQILTERDYRVTGNLKSEQHTALGLNEDRRRSDATYQPKTIDNLFKRLNQIEISPTGNKTDYQASGEIINVQDNLHIGLESPKSKFAQDEPKAVNFDIDVIGSSRGHQTERLPDQITPRRSWIIDQSTTEKKVPKKRRMKFDSERKPPKVKGSSSKHFSGSKKSIKNWGGEKKFGDLMPRRSQKLHRTYDSPGPRVANTARIHPNKNFEETGRGLWDMTQNPEKFIKSLIFDDKPLSTSKDGDYFFACDTRGESAFTIKKISNLLIKMLNREKVINHEIEINKALNTSERVLKLIGVVETKQYKYLVLEPLVSLLKTSGRHRGGRGAKTGHNPGAGGQAMDKFADLNFLPLTKMFEWKNQLEEFGVQQAMELGLDTTTEAFCCAQDEYREVVGYIISDLLIACDYMHRRGIIHRNINPDNIFISKVTKKAKFIKLWKNNQLEKSRNFI